MDENIKILHKKIESLIEKIFSKKLSFDDLGIEEVGHNYCFGIKNLERVF